jgi:hypothetical protein
MLLPKTKYIRDNNHTQVTQGGSTLRPRSTRAAAHSRGVKNPGFDSDGSFVMKFICIGVRVDKAIF